MKEIVSNIGFEDGSYRSCETNGNDLIVYIDSWDEKTIKLVFFNAIQFICRLGSSIDNVYEIEETSILKEALNIHYRKIPKDHPFKSFAIVDVDDRLFFEVVAEGISATKEE